MEVCGGVCVEGGGGRYLGVFGYSLDSTIQTTQPFVTRLGTVTQLQHQAKQKQQQTTTNKPTTKTGGYMSTVNVTIRVHILFQIRPFLPYLLNF